MSGVFSFRMFYGDGHIEYCEEPQNWIRMENMTINDGHDSSWKYNAFEVYQGQMFRDKRDLQVAVIR